MWFRFSLLADYTVPSAFIPLSLLAFHVQLSAYSTKETVPYHTTRRDLGFHHICSQRPTPVLSASAYFNKFAVLVRMYSVRIVNSVSFACSQFSSLVLRPGTSACFFSLACLSSTVAGTPKHQCSLFGLCSCWLAQRRSGASPSPPILIEGFRRTVRHSGSSENFFSTWFSHISVSTSHSQNKSSTSALHLILLLHYINRPANNSSPLVCILTL